MVDYLVARLVSRPYLHLIDFLFERSGYLPFRPSRGRTAPLSRQLLKVLQWTDPSVRRTMTAARNHDKVYRAYLAEHFGRCSSVPAYDQNHRPSPRKLD